jgi:hypothetical protein
MKSIKTYDEFVNEEINLKKAVTGAALGASLAFGTPAISQNKITPNITQTSEQDTINWDISIEELKSEYRENTCFWLNNHRTLYSVEVKNYKFHNDNYKANFVFENRILKFIELDGEFSRDKLRNLEKYLQNTYGKNSKIKYSLMTSNDRLLLKFENLEIKKSVDISTQSRDTETSGWIKTDTIKSDLSKSDKSTQVSDYDRKFEMLRKELIQMKNEQTEVKLNLYKCHKQFRVGVGMVGAGIGLGLLGSAMVLIGDRTSVPIAIIGGVFGTSLGLAGSITMIDSHKFIGRASLSGIKVEFGGSQQEKKVEPGDYFLYMGPGQ